MLRRFLFAALAVAALAAAPMAFANAGAPAPSDTSVRIGPMFDAVRPAIESVAFVVITAIGGFLAARLNTWFGINIEARHREALQSALLNGVRLGLDRVGGRATGLSIDVRKAWVAQAVAYVTDHVPDAVRHFGLTEERIADMARAKIPLVEAEVAPRA